MFFKRFRKPGAPAAGANGAGGANSANGADGPVYLIVGLGNPGRDYDATRHNVGFRAVDEIAERTRIGVQKRRFRALVGEGRHEGHKLVLLKPQTYMNLSGEAVREAVRYYKPDLSHLVLIYDDVDIPLGSIRIRPFGSPGTHNGMRSVTDSLDDGQFPRVRIGIGKPPPFVDLRDFVLTRFSAAEKEPVDGAVRDAAGAALDIVALGVERAMNLHNPKKPPRRSENENPE
ncbi:MAG: aminoacyl-tRNA hydrolase [Clostridiales bacterium]|jgi:PTH1 family peptidyl-tRNA hydrolase|nr:aminoacyl-tRNA hydrolase [Clostridiales bacterium]